MVPLQLAVSVLSPGESVIVDADCGEKEWILHEEVKRWRSDLVWSKDWLVVFKPQETHRFVFPYIMLHSCPWFVTPQRIPCHSYISGLHRAQTTAADS